MNYFTSIRSHKLRMMPQLNTVLSFYSCLRSELLTHVCQRGILSNGDGIECSTKRSSSELLVNLGEQSLLGMITKVELATEFFDDFFRDFTLVNSDVLHVLTAVELDLEHADGLIVELIVNSSRLVARLRLRLASSV